jgi:hypothetical protein
MGLALAYELDDPRFESRLRAAKISPYHRVQTGSKVHPASYPMGNKSSFPGGKAAGEWNWPLTSI